MIRLFELLFHGCWHKWGEPYGRPVEHYDVSFGSKSYMYTTQMCRCDKCGRFKALKVAS